MGEPSNFPSSFLPRSGNKGNKADLVRPFGENEILPNGTFVSTTLSASENKLLGKRG